jgi:hypothetical protein
LVETKDAKTNSNYPTGAMYKSESGRASPGPSFIPVSASAQKRLRQQAFMAAQERENERFASRNIIKDSADDEPYSTLYVTRTVQLPSGDRVVLTAKQGSQYSENHQELRE